LHGDYYLILIIHYVSVSIFWIIPFLCLSLLISVSLELSLSHWVCTLWYGAKAKTIQTQRRHHLQQSTQRHHSFQLPHLISNTDFLRNLCIVALLLLLPHKSAIVMCVNFLLSVSTLGRDSIRLRQEAVSLALL